MNKVIIKSLFIDYIVRDVVFNKRVEYFSSDVEYKCFKTIQVLSILFFFLTEFVGAFFSPVFKHSDDYLPSFKENILKYHRPSRVLCGSVQDLGILPHALLASTLRAAKGKSIFSRLRSTVSFRDFWMTDFKL